MFEIHKWPIRVYYEDTDSGGVVYHANYLCFFERARTEWLRSKSLEQDTLLQQYGIIFAVRSLSIDYQRPASFNQLLEVQSKVLQLKRTSITFEQKLFITSLNEHEPIVSAKVKVGCVNADIMPMKPMVMPQALMAQLTI